MYRRRKATSLEACARNIRRKQYFTRCASSVFTMVLVSGAESAHRMEAS